MYYIYKSKYKKVGVLPIRIVKSNVSSVGPVSLWRRTNARNVRLCYPYRQYTNPFIFRFLSEHCLRSTLRFTIIIVWEVRSYSCKSIFYGFSWSVLKRPVVAKFLCIDECPGPGIPLRPGKPLLYAIPGLLKFENMT